MERDIIAVGASAGGVDALRALVASLEEDFPAAILVAVHLLPALPSKLAGLLNLSGKLRARFAAEDDAIVPGRIYIAPPDRHMLVEGGRVRLWRGPRENRQRPAINALFRSVAVEYGKRAIGVILSGMLDDGSAGLWWIKKYGGLAVVQDPSDAAYPEMAENALRYVEVDSVAPLAAMGPLLAKLVSGKRKRSRPCAAKRRGNAKLGRST